ncbi:MAG: hypothetical protein R2813_00340 [Flavobacteriales bacterium]
MQRQETVVITVAMIKSRPCSFQEAAFYHCEVGDWPFFSAGPVRDASTATDQSALIIT